MDKKRIFEPGDMVTTFTGQVGMVISGEEFTALRIRLKEGDPGTILLQVVASILIMSSRFRSCSRMRPGM